MSNRTGVIYARQSFGHGMTTMAIKAPSRVAGVAFWQGIIWATGSQDPL